jgi:NADH-quinone oxidoreductase subunit L
MIGLIIFLPLIGAIIAGLCSKYLSERFVGIMTFSLVAVSAVSSFWMFREVIILDHDHSLFLLKWFDSGNLNVDWHLHVDSLTAVMLVVVNSVSSLVHLYSLGYMSHDPHKKRFMAYLSLFTFFMLMLVTADNFVQLFLGWEGVGLCSYLLIGFWFKKDSANKAAMKAFIVNRVGDFAFALGIFTILIIYNSLQFSEVFKLVADNQNNSIQVLGFDLPTIEIICVLLFIGSMGKSAQIGLHTWLPDAMEGPTPVSALIHAATMVTAGVFLVARCSPLFEYAPFALAMVTVVGAVTCLFAATIALTQNDIKKIIAYSTCSQLGYMFFACGVSAYSAGIFHLMTHAFFKALLFLGAGSVIHAMSGEQDINKMGGLWRKIPLTYSLMLIGSLALAGVYPFAGYFSKDIILEAAYASGTQAGKFAYWMGIGAAFCTAFYSWRLLIKVFHGKTNNSEEVIHHIHESPLSMTIPLILLAFGAIISGFYLQHFLKIVELGEFWRGAIMILPTHKALTEAHHVMAWVKLLPSVVGIAGIALAYLFYYFYPRIPVLLKENLKFFYNISYNKYYVDEIYDHLIVRPIRGVAYYLWKIVDVMLIDGVGPNGLAWLSRKLSSGIRYMQSGYLYHYALVIIISIAGLISWYMLTSFAYIK